MIRLITGTPGSGKTLWVVKQLLELFNRPDDKQRPIYSNIRNLKFDNVLDVPDDYRECPTGSLIIYDEAQQYKAFAKETRATDNECGKSLSTHRHGGYDIWLITQSPKLLNDFAMENVGEHVHIYRPRNKKTVRLYFWSYAVKNLTKSNFKDADDERVWRYEPHLYQYYKSAEVHTYEKRISQRTVSTLITAVFIFGVLGYFIANGIGKGKDMKDGDVLQAQSSPTQQSENHAELATPQSQPTAQTPEQMEIQRVASVFASETSCSARNSYGHILDISFDECMRYSNDPKLIQPSYLPTQQPTYQAQAQTDTTPQVQVSDTVITDNL